MNILFILFFILILILSLFVSFWACNYRFTGGSSNNHKTLLSNNHKDHTLTYKINNIHLTNSQLKNILKQHNFKEVKKNENVHFLLEGHELPNNQKTALVNTLNCSINISDLYKIIKKVITNGEQYIPQLPLSPHVMSINGNKFKLGVYLLVSSISGIIRCIAHKSLQIKTTTDDIYYWPDDIISTNAADDDDPLIIRNINNCIDSICVGIVNLANVKNIYAGYQVYVVDLVLVENNPYLLDINIFTKLEKTHDRDYNKKTEYNLYCIIQFFHILE